MNIENGQLKKSIKRKMISPVMVGSKDKSYYLKEILKKLNDNNSVQISAIGNRIGKMWEILEILITESLIENFGIYSCEPRIVYDIHDQNKPKLRLSLELYGNPRVRFLKASEDAWMEEAPPSSRVLGSYLAEGAAPFGQKNKR